MGKSQKNVILREATADDASQVLEYIDKVSTESEYLTFGKGEFNLSKEDEIQLIEKSKSDKLSLFLLAEIDGQIVGNLRFTSETRSRTRHFGKFGVSVLKEYWGLGIGFRLINYLLNWSQKNNVTKKINLEVREDNSTAIKLYKKMGFKIEGRMMKYFYKDDKYYDAIIMGIEID